MACNCAEEVIKELRKKAEEQLQGEVGFMGVIDSYFTNRIFIAFRKGDLNDQIKVPFSIPAKIEYQRRAKASGKVRDYKKETNIFPSYCLFCGKKYEEES